MHKTDRLEKLIHLVKNMIQISHRNMLLRSKTEAFPKENKRIVIPLKDGKVAIYAIFSCPTCLKRYDAVVGRWKSANAYCTRTILKYVSRSDRRILCIRSEPGMRSFFSFNYVASADQYRIVYYFFYRATDEQSRKHIYCTVLRSLGSVAAFVPTAGER